jgi:hypothetical protein
LTGCLTLKLRFTLVAPLVYGRAEFCQPQTAAFANVVAVVRSSSALSPGLKEQRGCGRRDVERLDPTPPWKRYESIAGSGDPRAQAFALASHHQHRRTLEIGIPSRRVGLSVGAPDPEASALGVGQPIGEIADVSYMKVLDRPSRGLAGRGGDGGGAALGDDDPAGAGELSGAADGAKVARVLDLIEGDDQGVVGTQQAAGIRIGIGIDFSDDTLVVGGSTEALQLLC